MLKSELITVAGMALVTYIPRMLPMVFMKELDLPEKLDKFLSLIPYTMLGALIFPGVFGSTDSIYASIGAVFACGLAAYRRLNPTYVVLIGIGTVFIIRGIQGI
jgi:branched-subunit amino acid transport protein